MSTKPSILKPETLDPKPEAPVLPQMCARRAKGEAFEVLCTCVDGFLIGLGFRV